MGTAASARLEALLRIPAIAQMAAMGNRFVTWTSVPDGKGKLRKIPLQANGRSKASSTDPSTWSSYEALARGLAREGVEGPGVVLGQVAESLWLVGVDLDLALSPVTGEIQPWARRWVDRLRTYGEVSPSGAGVKLFGTVTQLPSVLWDADEGKFKGKEATPPDAGMPEGAKGCGHDKAEIGIYPCARYFTFTGQHLPGTPTELADITEAFAELAAAVVGMGQDDEAREPAPEPQTETAPVEVDLSGLPAQLRELIEADPKLADSWARGTKLTKGKDASASGLEFSLLNYLAFAEHDDEQIELAIRHYPHGQIGGGKLKGGNADRRLKKLLREAERIRQKAKRWQESAAWYQELLCGEEGLPRDCLANGSTILRKASEFAGKIRFDEHRASPICRDMPWRQDGDWREWTNTDDIRLAEWCQLREVPLRPTTCADAVMAVADDARLHPIQDHLDGLVWDGTPRLNSWLEVYLGARVPDGKTEDEQAGTVAKRTYISEVGRRWCISAVARIYRPGCKADCALILEGSQGIGKSTALAALVPQAEWFSDEISDLGSKDSAQDLRGKWIIELAELSAMKRGDIERTKAFMSRATDHYRPSYGRRSQDFPRQCVFAGTTNSDTYFGDETGNRRFWPVKVGAIDVAGLREARDQLWAEAVAAFKAGEKWWLSAGVEKAAAEEQAERRIVDPWESYLAGWLEAKGITPVTIGEAFGALGLPLEKADQVVSNRIARIFRVLGLVRFQRREGSARVWAYRVSPVSPVGGTQTGDSQTAADAGVFASVTSVTSVTSDSHGYKGDPARVAFMEFDPNKGGGIPSRTFQKTGVSTGDTGDTPHPATFVATSEWQDVPVDAILPPGLQIEVDLTTGRKRARFAPSKAPPWTDDRAWIAEITRARGWDERVSKVVAWGKAAGGEVTEARGALGIVLPTNLKKGMALNELHRIARDLHIEVSMGGRA
jgi:predicted P-loop ATPase